MISFLDRTALVAELRRCALALKSERQEVVAVWLFGSLASARAAPGSDADLLIVLSAHPSARWFDRIPEYLAWFTDLPCDVDLFPLTLHEVATSSLAQAALRDGIELA
jgi:predicted nucleotidyltransferase